MSGVPSLSKSPTAVAQPNGLAAVPSLNDGRPAALAVLEEEFETLVASGGSARAAPAAARGGHPETPNPTPREADTPSGTPRAGGRRARAAEISIQRVTGY